MSGKGAVLVTLVEIRGGAARPLGAQMVVREDGRYCGFVSGGCVEAAAAFEALEMMGSGCDREIRYGEGSPWFDIVLPCGGGITLTLHKLRSAQPLLAVLNRLEQRKPAGLRYDPQAQSLVCLPTQTRTGWNLNGFEVGFRPCVRLMIYGRSLEAQATASLAAATGYDSHIFDLFPASSQRSDRYRYGGHFAVP
ncbi:xanthine dehydrogenase accessory factor [Escherichia coli]|nr:xanthine dehydrogenase accessory factor [Escherichia coli]